MTAPEIPSEIPHDAQITPAHVLAYMQDEVMPRIKAVEGIADKSYQILKAAGILNGKGEEILTQIVADQRATTARKQAWSIVRADLKHHFRFLSPSRHWLTVLFGSIVGAIGWQLVSHFSGIHLPPL